MDEAAPQTHLFRFDVAGAMLGMDGPPCPLQVRFLPHGDLATMLVLVPAGRTVQAGEWMQRHTGVPATPAPGIAPRTLRCEFKPALAGWDRWLSPATVIQLDVVPPGQVALFAQGTSTQLSALARVLGNKSHPWRHGQRGPNPEDTYLLTSRQLEILYAAVSLGYYDVPHRIDLRALGRSMGLSVSAASQLLRRAQAQVIRGYVNAHSLARGKRLAGSQEPVEPPDDPWPGPPDG